jgi:hypothetical protein
MSRPTFVEARSAFKNVIGKGFKDTTVSAMIASMANPATGVKFVDAVISLAPISMEEGVIRIDTGRKARNNTGQFWGQGASGTIQKGASGLIYKKIVIDIDITLEDKVREVFMEAWIQTIMGLDKIYGQNISQVRNIYRDISIVRGWEKTKQCILYITMDFNKYKIEDFFYSFGSPTVDNVKPQLIELGKILDHFDELYNFRHRDFHQGNIMFAEDKSVRLIDFGRSCLTFDWSSGGRKAIFSMPQYGGTIPPVLLGENNASCYSMDLLTLLISVIEYHKDNVSAPLYEFLNNLVTSRGGKNLFTYTKKLGISKSTNKRDPDAAYWQTYPDKFGIWTKPMLNELVNCPTVTPNGFLSRLIANTETTSNNNNSKNGGSNTFRRRKSRKHKTTLKAISVM